jgi:hypothetical protein
MFFALLDMMALRVLGSAIGIGYQIYEEKVAQKASFRALPN